MSMSPDDPNLGLNNSMYSPLMGIAMGLLQAGGPSRMPVSLGQALGQGMGTGQQFEGAGIQNALQRLQLRRMAGIQSLLAGQSSAQPPGASATPAQTPAAAGTDSASVTNGLTAPASPSADVGAFPGNLLNSAPAQASPRPQAPATPQGPPALLDATQDAEYQRLSRIAQVMDLSQPGSGAGYAAAAQQRLETLSKTQQPYTPPNAIPGFNYTRNPYTGAVTQTGEARYGDVTYQDPVSGQMIHARLDKTTGTATPYNLPGNGGPATPKPGDEVLTDDEGKQVVIPAQYKQQVHNIAKYDQNMPSSVARNPTLAANMATWVHAVNPDWSEGQFQAKNDVLKSAAGGADAKQLDAFNTIQSHLSTLKQAWVALHNGDIQGANKLVNWAGMQFGNDAKNNANVVNTLVSREMGKVLASGGNFTDADKKEANSVLSTSLSPTQQGGAIDYIQKLIGGKTSSIVQRFKANKLTDGDIRARFNNDAWGAYQNFEGSQPQGASSNTGNWVYDPSTGTMKQR